jgi:hypothetical protein
MMRLFNLAFFARATPSSDDAFDPTNSSRDEQSPTISLCRVPRTGVN